MTNLVVIRVSKGMPVHINGLPFVLDQHVDVLGTRVNGEHAGIVASGCGPLPAADNPPAIGSANVAAVAGNPAKPSDAHTSAVPGIGWLDAFPPAGVVAPMNGVHIRAVLTGSGFHADVVRAAAAEVVRYHAPTPRQLDEHEHLASAAEQMIVAILNACPPCADRSAAIRSVREAKMTASAAVALDGAI